VPVGRVIDEPSIDIKGRTGVDTGYHRPERPDKHDREKKKRLRTSVAYGWLKVLEGKLGKYTELDDTVAAIYKGLPWQVRRWRGRDGVWRDRDPSTRTRLSRLYDEIGRLDIEKAVIEVIKNEVTDRAIGAVGNRLKKFAGEKLPGQIGFQTGGSRISELWHEVYYKALKEKAAKKHYEKQTYVKWVKVYVRRSYGYNKTTGKYYEIPPHFEKQPVNIRQGVTEVPWFRKKGRLLTKTGYYGTRRWHDVYYEKS